MAVARKRVEDAQTAIKLELDDMRNAEKAELTTTKLETTFEEMLSAIGDNLSDLASSDNGVDGEAKDDEDEDPAGGKLSEDDQPGWIMGTISKTVQYCMEHFRQKQMKLHELTQRGWGDAADNFRDSDIRGVTNKFKVPAVVQPQTADDAVSSVPTTFGEPMGTLDSVPGKVQMPQLTSRPGSSHMRLGSQKPQTKECIPSFPSAPMPDWSLIQQSKHVQPISFDICISHHKLITT